jgi:DNA-binding transcriptional LysR family regulator
LRIEQLEYIAAVTRFGSLRRASERMHVSQPALSDAISKLERELGVELLDRHRSGACISEAGRELLQPIVDVLDSVDRLKATAGDSLAARRKLRIGTVNAGTASLLLPAIHGFQDQWPGSTVEVRNLQQDEIQTGLEEGTLDLGLVNLLDGDDAPPDMNVIVLCVGRPVVVLPAGHRLCDEDAVTVEDLRGERFIAMRAGYLMHRFVHRLFGAEQPAVWNSTDGAEMGKLMVAEGIGLTILPDFSVRGDPLERTGLIHARPIAGDHATVQMVAPHRRKARLAGAVRELLDHLCRRAASPGAQSVPGVTPCA